MFREFVLVAVLLIGIAASKDLPLKDGEEFEDFNDGVAVIGELEDVEELDNFNFEEVANLTVTLSEKALQPTEINAVFNPLKQTLRYRMGQRHYRK